METELQAQLHQVRSRFAGVYDAAYRIERMLRFTYWLRNLERAPRNLLGSWTVSDITAEIELWRSLESMRLDEQAIYALLIRRLQDQYDQSVEEAVLVATDSSLASRGLPIWNPDVEALLPQSIDALRIYEAVENHPDHLGRTYKFRLPDGPVSASLYFYPKQWLGVLPGLEDARLRDAFSQSAEEMTAVARHLGARLTCKVEPVAENLSGDDGVAQTVATVLFLRVGADGAETDEYLSMAGFRGRYFKLRVTIPAAEPADRPNWFDVRCFNRDLAMFLAFYGP